MSTKDRRKRGATRAPALPGAVPAPAVAPHQPVPMPKWQWRTFPVFFMFAVGGFIGVYMGLLAYAAENDTATLVVFLFWALLLGFGLSRLTSRWMISRGWHRTQRKR